MLPTSLSSIGFSLFPDFVDVAKERELLAWVDHSDRVWNNSLKRRTQHYGFEYDYKKKTGLLNDLGRLPDILESLAKVVQEKSEQEEVPNQVIVNEYMPGQGISAHVDDVRSYGDCICSVSLGSDVVMRIESKDDAKKFFDVNLPRRSLLVMKAEGRYDWKHSIPARKKDGDKVRNRRVSLTFRCMSKASNNNAAAVDTNEITTAPKRKKTK